MTEDFSANERVEVTSSDTHFQVPVIIHGKTRSIPVRLLLDTGATKVVIPAWVVRNLGLEFGKEESVETPIGSMQLRTTAIPRIQIRGSDLEAQAVPGWIGNSLLLGMSFLKHFKFHVEYGNNLVIEK